MSAAYDLYRFGPYRLAGPLFCVPWRAVVKPANFSIWMHGRTGTFKTERAALTMQHVGRDFTSGRLYASWHSDTPNALREKVFLMKDAPALLDDYRPGLTAAERAAQQQVLDQILRATGNRAGRGTMTSDQRLRPGRAPRCLPIITAEDLPYGESTKGRALLLEVRPGDLLTEQLSKHQKAAALGQFVTAMSAFITWLAPNRNSVLERWDADFDEWRKKETLGQHSRTPGIVADLYLGAKLFFEFAIDMGVVTDGDAATALHMIWKGLIETSQEQASIQLSDKPEVRFIELLRSSIASGGSYLTNREGKKPDGNDVPFAWGWRQDDSFGWKPIGTHIGWMDLDQGEVYLDPAASYKAATAMVGDGDALAASGRTLAKRMNEAHLLVRTEQHQRARSTLTCRVMLQGVQRDVLVVKVATLIENTGE